MIKHTISGECFFTFYNVSTGPAEALEIDLPAVEGKQLVVEVSGSGYLKCIFKIRAYAEEFVGFIYHSTLKVDLPKKFNNIYRPSRILVIENRDKGAMNVYVRVRQE